MVSVHLCLLGFREKESKLISCLKTMLEMSGYLLF